LKLMVFGIICSLFSAYFFVEDFSLSFLQIVIISCALGYFLYYRAYRNYVYEYYPEVPQSIFRGKTPPCYPNGWYVLSHSKDLKPLEAKAIKKSGYDVVLFRGESGEVYALHAFCPHSGANLGVGGQVKHKSCVQCPFHGWLFDGKTGNLVSGESLKSRKVDFYEYNEKIGTCQIEKDEMLKKTGSGPIKLRKYPVKEINGYIYVWLHTNPETQPDYNPLDLTDVEQRLTYKGVSMNRIYAHCQDIVENGGDIRHFIYVHSFLLPFTKIFGATWDAKWVRADDPELRTKMKHKIPWVNEHKQKLFDKYLTKENSKNIGVMYLDMSMKFLNFEPIFFFNATVFQVGPGLVYLFLVSPFYEAVFFQHTSTSDKFTHNVYHHLYASNHLPHAITALMLRLEAQQVTNDTFIWNNKQFAIQPTYNLEAEADTTILTWRKWFSQFYEGCTLRESELNKYTW